MRLLQRQRDLYELPRDMNRFQAYLREMTGGSDDIVLPITAMNPMGKEKAVAAYDALLAVHAEDIAQTALDDAIRRLRTVPGKLRVALVVLDDAQGAWSQPDQNESAQWESDAMAKRGFAVAHFRSTQAPHAPSTVRREVLAAIYHQAWILRHGLPSTLGDVLRLIGYRDRFAGVEPRLPPADITRAQTSIAPFLGRRAASPATFACMFGDEAARAWGLDPVGVPARAGFEVALANALSSAVTPEAALAP